MAQNENLLTALTNFAREHVLWTVGLIPFAVVALDLLVACQGNPEVFGYMLQNIDVLSIVLSQTLPMIPMALVLLWIYWFVSGAHIIETNAWSAGINGAATLMLSSLVVFAMPVAHILVAIFFIVMLAFIRMRDRRKAHSGKLRFGADTNFAAQPILQRLYVQAMLGSLALLQVVTFSLAWIPPEIIAVNGQRPTTGRILSSTQEWTTYLERFGRARIRIVRTRDVTSRKPCSTNLLAALSRSPAYWMSESQTSEEPCPVPDTSPGGPPPHP